MKVLMFLTYDEKIYLIFKTDIVRWFVDRNTKMELGFFWEKLC